RARVPRSRPARVGQSSPASPFRPPRRGGTRLRGPTTAVVRPQPPSVRASPSFDYSTTVTMRNFVKDRNNGRFADRTGQLPIEGRDESAPEARRPFRRSKTISGSENPGAKNG